MKKRKGFLSLLFAVGCIMAFNLQVFAADPESEEQNLPEVTAEDAVAAPAAAMEVIVDFDNIDSPSITYALPSSSKVLSETPVVINDQEMIEVEFTTADGSDTVILPRSIYGYAAHDAHNSTGSFTVYAPGSATGTGGATFKTSGFSGGQISMSLKRPNNTYAISGVVLNGNDEVVKSFTNAQPGTYTCPFTIYGTSLGQLHLWVY